MPRTAAKPGGGCLSPLLGGGQQGVFAGSLVDSKQDLCQLSPVLRRVPLEPVASESPSKQARIRLFHQEDDCDGHSPGNKGEAGIGLSCSKSFTVWYFSCRRNHRSRVKAFDVRVL